MVSRVLLILVASLSARSVQAMQFEAADVSASDMLIGGRGPIVHGDAARLERAFGIRFVIEAYCI
jgi:hypothetical protein